MKLESTTHFNKRLSKKIKKNPILKKKINTRLQLLLVDISSPTLKTHKLKGQRHEEYAIYIEENLRIVFTIVKETILLIDIVTHDEY